MNTLLQTWNTLGINAVGVAAPMLLQSSILVALLFLLDRWLRERAHAAVRYALWTLVLIKLMLPPSAALPTSVAYWCLPPTRAAATPAVAPVQSRVRLEVMTTSAQRPPTVPTSIDRPSLRWQGWVLLGWFGGALLVGGRALRHSIRVHRLLRGAAVASGDVTALFTDCARRLRITKRVELRMSDRVGVPAVCGLFRPAVMLPGALAAKLQAEALRSIFFHELTHIRRGDLWVGHLQTLLQVVYWWHPLIWLANARIRSAREEAVDDAVVAVMEPESEVYPGTLLEVARHALARPPMAIGFIGVVESTSMLRRRVERLLAPNSRSSAPLGLRSAIAVGLLAFLVLPMVGRTGKATEPGSPTSGDAAATSAVSAPAAEPRAPSQYVMSPELLRRYGLVPRTNTGPRAPGMDPEMARRYGLNVPPGTTSSAPASQRPFSMNPQLAKRYGLISPTNPTTDRPSMSPELLRRYGLVPRTNTGSRAPGMDPEMARRYGQLPGTNAEPKLPSGSEMRPNLMDPKLAKRYGLILPTHATNAPPAF